MINNLLHVTYSHPEYYDVARPCLARLQRHWKGLTPLVLFTTSGDDPVWPREVYYNDEDAYRERLLSCLKQVDEEFVLYSHEDMILYDDVSEGDMRAVLEFMAEDDNLAYVKFLKADTSRNYTIDRRRGFFGIIQDPCMFAVQPSIWRRAHLIAFLEMCPRGSSIWELERVSGRIWPDDLSAAFTFRGEPKRGLYHYDSSYYPYTATAIVKGQWNTKEYPAELAMLFREHSIDKSIRGEFK